MEKRLNDCRPPGPHCRNEDPHGHRRDAGGSVAPQTGPNRIESPFQQHGAPAWYNDNEKAQHESLPESMRLGTSGVKILQTMFPGRHNNMRSGLPSDKDTLYVPVVFRRLHDWYFDNSQNSEVRCSKTFFSHVAVAIAFEFALAKCAPLKKTRRASSSYLF